MVWLKASLGAGIQSWAPVTCSGTHQKVGLPRSECNQCNTIRSFRPRHGGVKSFFDQFSVVSSWCNGSALAILIYNNEYFDRLFVLAHKTCQITTSWNNILSKLATNLWPRLASSQLNGAGRLIANAHALKTSRVGIVYCIPACL